MVEKPIGTTPTRTRFEDIQAHYDVSDDFFALFQDPTRTYSCAYFEPPDLTLEEAQIAKIDLNLDQLDLKPGMTLLDIGCGWGTTMKRAVERYDVNVIGLTLSENQHSYCQQLLANVDTNRSYRVLLSDWADFTEPVDRIITIEALEHFGFQRYEFFRCGLQHPACRRGVDATRFTGLTGGQIVERGMPVIGVRDGSLHQVHHHRDLPRRPATSIEKVEGHATAGRGFPLWPAFIRCSSIPARTLDFLGRGLGGA